MIDWLLRPPRETPVVEVAGRALPLTIRRSAQARRMTLRLAPDGSEARVTLPRWGRTAEAVAFAISRADWLAGQLAKVPAPVVLSHGSTMTYRGEALTLHHDPRLPRRISLGSGVLTLGGPAETLGPRLRRWLELEARRLFADDLADYCQRAAVPIPALALSRAQRRWGSCARNGTIRLNWRLIMAPDEVRRSVVAHEVAHLLHFDHSPYFHAALATLFEGDPATVDRWLKRNGRSLYAPFG